MSFSLIHLVLHVLITCFSYSTPLKAYLNFLDMYFCVFFKGRYISSSTHFFVLNSFERYWICKFFRSDSSESDFG